MSASQCPNCTSSRFFVVNPLMEPNGKGVCESCGHVWELPPGGGQPVRDLGSAKFSIANVNIVEGFALQVLAALNISPDGVLGFTIDCQAGSDLPIMTITRLMKPRDGRSIGTLLSQYDLKSRPPGEVTCPLGTRLQEGRQSPTPHRPETPV